MYSSPTVAALSVRLDYLEDRALEAEAAAIAAELRYRRAEKRFRVLCGTLLGGITLSVLTPLVSPAVAQGCGMTLDQAATRIAALETKTAFIITLTEPQTNPPTVRFSGVNVQIVNGKGGTEEAVHGTCNPGAGTFPSP